MHRPFAITEPLPAVEIMRRLGLEPDPWQIEVLETPRRRVLLNCCRQAGKTTTVAVLALVAALCRPLTKVLVLSRSHRQAKEVIRLISFYHLILKNRGLQRKSASEINFENLSRIVSLPCKEETIRGYAHVDLIILDEAARVPDDLYRAIRPMLAVSEGRLFCLSTPYGKRGFFWDSWAKGGDDWRFEVQANQVPRIKPEFLEEERRAMGESWYRQEYCCSFEALEGLVYPDFAKCVVAELPPSLAPALARTPAPTRDLDQADEDEIRGAGGRAGAGAGAGEEFAGRWFGGIDFGFRNPFAAVWGVLDRDDVLWLVGEHYQRQQPLSWHARHLPRQVMWHADPAGANEIAELRCAGFTVRKGTNALELGIAAVHARLAAGTLKVLAGRCPNLLAEAGLYRFGESSPGDRRSEAPVDDHNHALGALRYLIARIDQHKLARSGPAGKPADETPLRPVKRERTLTELLEDESLWITF